MQSTERITKEQIVSQTGSRFVDLTRVLLILRNLRTTAHANAKTLSRDDGTSTDANDRKLAIKWFEDMERVINEHMNSVDDCAETCKQLRQRCDWY